MRYLSIAFILISSCISAQSLDTLPIAKKVEFVQYLKTNRQMDDALYLLHYFNALQRIDSLQLMEVKFLLDAKREKDADSLLQQISGSISDTMINKCRITLLQNHCAINNERYSDLKEPQCYKHPLHAEVWKLQLLTAYTFQHKFEEFDMIFNSRKCNDANLSLTEFYLYVQMQDLKNYRRKKPFVAGLLSAIIPGSGKIYTKKPHEALFSFMPVAFNFAQAAEGYYYKKFESPHLYVFGGIGSVFYASSIVGSARSATRKNEEFYSKIKANIDLEIGKLVKYY